MILVNVRSERNAIGCSTEVMGGGKGEVERGGRGVEGKPHQSKTMKREGRRNITQIPDFEIFVCASSRGLKFQIMEADCPRETTPNSRFLPTLGQHISRCDAHGVASWRSRQDVPHGDKRGTRGGCEATHGGI